MIYHADSPSAPLVKASQSAIKEGLGTTNFSEVSQRILDDGSLVDEA
ncbi:hypothetical protein [Streptomyces sp. NPDC088748]